MSFFNADTLVSGTDGLLLKDLGTTATTPSSGYGSLYVNSDALYFVNDSGSSTNLLSGGSARSVAGDTDNGIITWVTSDNTFAAEANFTYDGTNLTMTSSSSDGTNLKIDNTAADGDSRVEYQLSGTTIWSTGVEDGDSDKFVIEAGSDVLGAVPAAKFSLSTTSGLSTTTVKFSKSHNSSDTTPSSDDLKGGEIQLLSGDGGSSDALSNTSNSGGSFTIKTGSGGNHYNDYEAQDSGSLYLMTGTAGNHYSDSGGSDGTSNNNSGYTYGGNSGDIYIVTSNGGSGYRGGTAGNIYLGSNGGSYYGSGGTGNSSAGGGGTGTSIYLYGGYGGEGYQNGSGGSISLTSGPGKSNSFNGGSSGYGGTLTLTSGAGGTNFSNSSASSGGSISITGGTGGSVYSDTLYSTPTNGTGGGGASITITSGGGGYGYNGGNGGDLSLYSGYKGTGETGSGGSNGSDGVVNIGVSYTDYQIVGSDMNKFEKNIFIQEGSSATTDVAGYGQLWVKNETPCQLYFTTDAGDDIQLTNGTSIAGGGSISGNNYATDLKIGRDADNLIDFATTDNKIIFRVEGVNELELVQNAFSPITSDGVALGTASLMWSDLFLASGSVINFNAGEITLTHVANNGLNIKNSDVLYTDTLYTCPKEDFSATNFDLSNKTITYKPSGSGYYVTKNNSIAFVSISGHTQVTSPTSGSMDDGYQTVNFTNSKSFKFNNVSYTTVYIGTNGYLTFDSGRTSYPTAVDSGWIALWVLGDDLNTGGDDATLHYHQTEDTFIVTYTNVPDFGTTIDNSMQITLYFNSHSTRPNEIDVNYGDIAAASLEEVVIGITDGSSTPTSVDFSTLPSALTPLPSQVTFTLQTAKSSITTNDIIGTVNFQAPDVSSGGDSILVAAGIEAIAETTFSASSNATKLSFKTGSSEAAAEKMKLSSGGNLSLVSDSSAISFGANSDITLTHMANTGIKISSLATNDGVGGLTSSTAFPNLTLHNTSNSPADGDYIGGLFLNGEDDSSNETTYASIVGRIKDQTDTEEDGALLLRTNVAGTETTVLDFGDTRAGNTATFSGDVNIEKANDAGDVSIGFLSGTEAHYRIGIEDSDNKFRIAYFTSGNESPPYAFDNTPSISISPGYDIVLKGHLDIEHDGNDTYTPNSQGVQINVEGASFTDSATSADETASEDFIGVKFGSDTLSADNSNVTTTNAATLYIEGPATVGTNQTITNNYALWVDSGNAKFGGTIIGNLTGDVTGNSVTISDTLRIAQNGSGLRMTNVGAFDNDGSNNFRIFSTNSLILSTNGDSNTALTIDTSGNFLVNTTKKLQFNDSETFIYSSADGQLDIDADTTLQLSAPTLDIDSSTAVTIDTKTTTITGTDFTLAQNASYDVVKVAGGTVTEYNGASTHAKITSLHITPPTITNDATATVTDASTVYISGPTAATGANNYALWVDSGDVRFDGSLKLTETSAATADEAGKGQLWVKDSTPNELYFTNDAGNDIQITTQNNNIMPGFPSSIEIQTSNGHTDISGSSSIMIKACGSGGGGGGAGTSSSDGDAGGGGGSGEYAEIYLNSSDIGSYTHIYSVISSGGTGGGTATANGSNAIATTIRFASSNIDTTGPIIATIAGGGGGYHGNAWGKSGIGGLGGSISTGTGFLLPGRNGDQGTDVGGDTSLIHYTTGGNGGDSHLGRGGMGAQGNASAPTTTGEGFGFYGGGGGGGVVGNGNEYSSSDGSSGVIFIYIY